jgi:hypothetical protein
MGLLAPVGLLPTTSNGLPLLPLLCCFFAVLVRAEPPEPRPLHKILLGIGDLLGFW